MPGDAHGLDTFEKKAHQPFSLPEDARTHSHPSHIFKRNLISYPACQNMPEHTYNLDTEEASSAIQLPEEARTHSLPGHIVRRSLISHPACQKMPEDTHILDTFSEGASLAIQLGRRCQNTLTPWAQFQKEHHQPFSLPRCQNTHILNTEDASSAI